MAVTNAAHLVSGGSFSYLAAEWLVEQIGQEAAQLPNMSDTMWNENLEGDSTLTAHFRFVTPLTASSATDGGVNLPVSTWDPTGVTIAAGLDGLSVQFTKLTRSIAPEALPQIAQQAAASLVRAIDTAGALLFASLTAGTVGTSAGALVLNDILQAQANLNKNHAEVAGPYYGRLHPQAFYDLQKDIVAKNYGVAKISLDAMGRDVIMVGGTEIKTNSLVPTINSGVDYAGGIYSYQAMGLAIAQSPMVEVLSIPGQHTFSVDATIAFGVGVVRPTFGCLVRSGINA